MKSYKVIKRLLAICTVLLLSTTNVFAKDVTTNSIQWEYTVFDSDGNVIKNGILPSPYLRYTWPDITLNNGDSVTFTPSHSSSGLFAQKGTQIKATYTLNRMASHTFTVFNTNGETPAGGQYNNMGTTVLFSAPSSSYYKGQIINTSSDPITVKGFSITF